MLVVFYILMLMWISVFIVALSNQKRKGKFKKITFNQFVIVILISIGTMILTIGILILWGALV